jgi:hypothetical protein
MTSLQTESFCKRYFSTVIFLTRNLPVMTLWSNAYIARQSTFLKNLLPVRNSNCHQHTFLAWLILYSTLRNGGYRSSEQQLYGRCL